MPPRYNYQEMTIQAKNLLALLLPLNHSGRNF